MKHAIIPLLLSTTTTPVSSFLHPIATTTPFLHSTQTTSTTHTVLSMAGFGGGASSSSKKRNNSKTKGGNKNSTTLKPKTQWDKYKNLQTASSVVVAMRVVMEGGEGFGPWLDVGMIKSEGDEFTEVAVALQKGIISEHAKRLHPLQFLPKDKVEWGYASSTSGDDDNSESNGYIAIDR